MCIFFPNWHYASKYLRWRLSFQLHYTVAVLILGVDYKLLPLLTVFIVRLFSVAFILHSWWWWCCWNPSQLTWTEGEVRSSSQGHIKKNNHRHSYTHLRQFRVDSKTNMDWERKPKYPVRVHRNTGGTCNVQTKMPGVGPALVKGESQQLLYNCVDHKWHHRITKCDGSIWIFADLRWLTEREWYSRSFVSFVLFIETVAHFTRSH